MQIYKLSVKELRIIVLRKISKLQKNTESSVKPGKHFMNKISSTKIEILKILKEKQILGLKNRMNLIERVNSRFHQEEIICKSEGRSFEII